MTRTQLEHIIRAAGAIADDDLIVVGSQSVLGQFPAAPAELLIPRKAEVYPANHPDRTDLIDGTIGEGSPFEAAFGYYAHGVGEETCVLPAGWRQRLVLVSNENTRGYGGWCLDVHDLAVAKYAAGREKDMDSTDALVRHGLVRESTLEARLADTPLPPDAQQRIAARIRRQFVTRRA